MGSAQLHNLLLYNTVMTAFMPPSHHITHKWEGIDVNTSRHMTPVIKKKHHLTALNLEQLTDGVLFKLTRSINRVMERNEMPFRLELNLDVAAR